MLNTEQVHFEFTRYFVLYFVLDMVLVITVLYKLNLVIGIPELNFLIPGSGIEKFVIPGSCFGIRLTDWSLFWYPQLTILCTGPHKRYIRTVESDGDCQNTNYSTQHEVVLYCT